jgi:putative transposase
VAESDVLRPARSDETLARMPRKLRDVTPGLHHVTVGATGPSPYFRDDADRLTWIRYFVRTLASYGWTCVIVCQMTTHVHVLLHVPDESLPVGMHRLNTAYGKGFNDRHDRRGNLVRARYWSKRATDDAALRAAFRYIARNPTRAGICERPEDWHWSSFATSCGLADTFPFADATCVLAALEPSPAAPAQALIRLVRD